MAYRTIYWVSPTPTTWQDTSAWSSTSGGIGGEAYPDTTTIAIFDMSSSGPCVLSTPSNCAGLQMISPFDGTISQNSRLTAYGNGLVATAGRFNGGSSNFEVYGPVQISCYFQSPDATFQLHGDSTLGTGFQNNNGTVALYSGSKMNVQGMSLYKLDVRYDPIGAPLPATVDGSCTVLNDLSLTSGCLKSGTDSTIYARKDLYVYSDFGAFDSRNNANIEMDGSTKQSIYSYGGIIPTLKINKDETFQVVCWGSNPVLINNQLYIQDGTFNTQGRDVQVGL